MRRLRLEKIPYFYPRSPCGERRRRSVKLFRQNYISIHALLAESDPGLSGPAISVAISIHALLAESDRLSGYLVGVYSYFYPRSPCGERLYDTYAKVLRVNISIHALLAESDIITRARNSTIRISIHALLAESDTPEG